MAANPTKQAAFLAAYVQTGNITEAAKVANVARKSHYLWMKDPAYVERFQACVTESAAVLEDEARRRAVAGWDEPVYQNGKLVGHKRRYSDTLLIFLLKGNNPEKFGDKVKQELSGSVATVETYAVQLPDNGRGTLYSAN